MFKEPITVAALSESWTAFARSNTGVVGSNSTRGMDVCVPCDGLIPRPNSPTECV
jgi:hypothetical protein